MGKQMFPEPTVGALIFNPKGEIFLMKSHKWRGKYVIPGGHIELGETMEKALKREVKEETGMTIYEPKFLLFAEFVYGKEFWKKRHFLFFDFAAKTKLMNIKLNDEGQEYIWVKPEKALTLSVEPYSLNAIRKFLKLKF
jgi:nucleoside triphosphatase